MWLYCKMEALFTVKPLLFCNEAQMQLLAQIIGRQIIALILLFLISADLNAQNLSSGWLASTEKAGAATNADPYSSASNPASITNSGLWGRLASA